MSQDRINPYLTGSLGAVFIRTSLPIIFVMAMNGLVTVLDALFLGVFVGPEALGAVTLMFPAYMLVVALTTLVGSGIASQVARYLGAGNHSGAQAVFVGAHGLALAISGTLILAFAFFGADMTRLFAGGENDLAEMGHTYMGIMVYFSPLVFVLAINSDAIRSEGHLSLMAAISLLVSIGNIAFNYALIVMMDYGVAGSAYGTVLAQLTAFVCLLLYRFRGKTVLRPAAFLHHSVLAHWRPITVLGVPQSLSFVGVSLVSAAVIASVQMIGSDSYTHTVSAYGIITRVTTFAILPLLGLSHAMQSIVGNNFGAALWQRSNMGLGIAVGTAIVYCLIVEAVLIGFAGSVGSYFIDDSLVIEEVARIMPVIISLFVIAGPLMLLSHYFQAIGKAAYAALLGLTKPYLFSIPLVFLLPQAFGEKGIWWAGPSAELCLLLLAAVTLTLRARKSDMKWGVLVKG